MLSSLKKSPIYGKTSNELGYSTWPLLSDL